MKLVKLLLIAFLMFGVNAYSAEYFSGNTMKVAFGDTLDQDIFAGCRQVEVFGYVAGDIYAGCETVNIEGKIQDDVLVGCRNFTLTGIINDGLIVFAESITIDGTVRGDVIAFGKQIRLTDRARLEGNIFIGCGEFTQEGAPIAGFLKGGAGSVYLNGPVGDEVELGVDNIDFGEKYTSGGGTFITVPEGFDESTLSYLPPNLELDFEEHQWFFQKTFFYWSLLSFLVVGVLLILIFKNSGKEYVTYARANLPFSLLAGIIFLIITPTVLSIISVFIITIPVALILFVLYAILVYLSFVFSALYIGDFIWGQIMKANSGYGLFWPLLIGLITICLVMQIPYLGWLFGFAFICFGSGSMIMYIWNTKKVENTATE